MPCPDATPDLSRLIVIDQTTRDRAETLRHAEPATNPVFASFAARVVGFTRAIIAHVAAGMPTLDDSQVEARLAICRECEWFDAEKIVCNVCKCGLLRKARMGDQHCPIGKW